MKRILSTLTSVGLAVLPAVAAAQGIPAEPATIGDINRVLINIRTAVWAAFTILAVIAFLYAAILYITAGGDADKVGKAKRATIFGIVGVVVAIIGYSVLSIVNAIITH